MTGNFYGSHRPEAFACAQAQKSLQPLEHLGEQRKSSSRTQRATMNRNQGKQGGKSSDSSPLSLLVHAADAQQQPPGGRGGGSDRSGKNEQGYRHDLLKDKAPSALEEHQLLLQRKAAAEHALQQQGGLLPSLDFYQQNALAAAAQQQQQQQQLASLALASDIRSALAAAHLRQQAAQFQNHDFLLARAAAAQGLGLGGGGLGNASIEKLQQDLELQRLEELERRQQLLAAAGRAPMAARQQMEMQEAQARQEQLDRQLQREGLLAAATARNSMGSGEVPSNPAAAAAASAAPQRRESGKEEFQKTPGSVIVPCRARGMPMDHNFKTAYFVIPENVQHGEELICSYFACRNAGIKFRYCTHCRVPVAKRNFRKRHKHGNSSNANDLDDDSNSGGEEETSIASNNKANGIPAQVVTTQVSSPVKKENPPPLSRKEKAAAKAEAAAAAAAATCTFISSPSKKTSMEPPAPVKPSSNDSIVSSEKPRPKPVSDDSDSVSLPSANKPEVAAAADPDTAASAAPTKSISEERKLRWVALLGMRPPTNDGPAMSTWLMEVLSLSDLATPLKEPGEGGGVAASALLSPANMVALNAFQHGTSNGGSDKPTSGTAQEKDSVSDAVPSGKESNKSILIKKKRPISVLNRGGDSSSREEEASRKEAAEASAAGYTGSFAEWRDRKKQKVLSKKGGGP